jgi:hypothetical protein
MEGKKSASWRQTPTSLRSELYRRSKLLQSFGSWLSLQSRGPQNPKFRFLDSYTNLHLSLERCTRPQSGGCIAVWMLLAQEYPEKRRRERRSPSAFPHLPGVGLIEDVAGEGDPNDARHRPHRTRDTLRGADERETQSGPRLDS